MYYYYIIMEMGSSIEFTIYQQRSVRSSGVHSLTREPEHFSALPLPVHAQYAHRISMRWYCDFVAKCIIF